MATNVFAVVVSLSAIMVLFVLSGKTQLMRRGLLFIAVGMLSAVGVHSIAECLEIAGILSLDYLLVFMPVLVALGSIIIGIGGIFVYRDIAEPLNEFMAGLKAMDLESDDIQRKSWVRNESANELGQVARAFMLMINKLSESRNVLKKHNQELESEVSRRVAEQSLLSTQLLHAQKMESIGRLAAGIAHEINTPTQFVGDNTRFLKDSFKELQELINKFQEMLSVLKDGRYTPELAEELQKAVETADIDYLSTEIPNAIDQSLEGIQRVAKIVRAMKEFSHPDVGEKSLTDLNKAIETTITVARNEWKYVADVKTELDIGLPLVSCLPGEINQVFLNLIVNAAHAIGGKKNPDNVKGMITISTKSDNKWVEIRISDTGAGISEKYKQRIFEPFFTTKEVGKGTGQGLAMAYNVVVKKHGGTITFETKEGEGTTFIILLPLEQG